MRFKNLVAVCGMLAVVGCGGADDGPVTEEVLDNHENGAKKTVIAYRGKKDNLVRRTFYAPDGSIMSDQEFQNGKPHGKFEIYKGGQLITQTFYKDSVKHGSDKSWYDDGKLKTEAEYAEGKPVGRYVNYFDDGTTPAVEVSFQDGKKHGEEITYYRNGNRKFVKTYNLGVQEGQETEYFEDGKVKEEHMYANDTKEGPFKIYSPKTGKVVEDGTYKNGQYFGDRTTYDEKSGRRTGVVTYDERGKRTGGEKF